MKIKFVTITDYDCKKEILECYKDSIIEEILTKGLVDSDEKKEELFQAFSYERMKEFNPEMKLKINKLKRT